MGRRLSLDRGAADVLRYLPPEAKKRIRHMVRQLLDDPLGMVAGIDVKRLEVKGDPTIYRARVGDWRVAYSILGDRLVIIRVFHRSEDYGWLEKL